MKNETHILDETKAQSMAGAVRQGVMQNTSTGRAGGPKPQAVKPLDAQVRGPRK